MRKTRIGVFATLLTMIILFCMIQIRRIVRVTGRGGSVMEGSDWLLLFVGIRPDVESPRRLSPIRIMKGMFLFTREGGDAAADLYHFEPYHYGPVSLGIYDDLSELVAEDFVIGKGVLGYSWLEYEVTAKGEKRLQELTSQADPALLELLQDIKTRVTSLSFRQLLRYIYTQYPEYAVHSVIGRL